MKKLTPEQLETLEEKIKNLVPELMELSFGCRVAIGFLPKRNIWIYAGVPNGMSEMMAGLVKGDKTIEFRKDELFILGHPITLSDVLLASKRRQKQVQKERGKREWIAVDLDGDFFGYEERSENPEKHLCSWSLDKPWEDQHEAHQFLFSYLCQ